MILKSYSVDEHSEQRSLVGWLTVRKIGCFSVPNGFIAGGKNKFGMIRKLKDEGMLNGAPDLILIPRAPDSGKPVAIEMKRVDHGRLSDEQQNVIASMRDAGWEVVVARGVFNAIEQLEALGF